MPKLKSILSRVIRGESRQKEDGLDYLCAGFERYMIESHSLAYPGRDDNDDGDSVSSFSTTATADNLPGTGRTLDTYIFQPMGRQIERLAMQFTIASLHPSHIAQYIETDYTDFTPSFLHLGTLNDAIANLCRERQNGSTIVAGMKGLVKQAQSASINRSASALAALIRVSLTSKRKEIYVILSRFEPIFHLDTLAGPLACSHPENKWFIFLVKLARETLITVKLPSRQRTFDPVLGREVYHLRPSSEAARKLRQRLMRALRVYKFSGLESLEDTLGEACAICAEAISTGIYYFARGAYLHILETVYFTVIFVLRSIHELVVYAKITANRQICMVLQTLASWIDAIVIRCLRVSDDYRRYDMDKLKVNMLFRSLIYAYGDTTCVLLPQSRLRRSDLFHMEILPRKHREAAESFDDIPIVQGLIEASKDRARRLFRSFNELEREVRGISLGISIPISYSQIVADPRWFLLSSFGDEWWTYWKKTLEMARSVQVAENSKTKEFREARRFGLEQDTLSDKIDRRWEAIHDQRSWGYYQLRRGSRHKWGQYLRSNMDWDWDLGACMKRLFKVKHTRGGHSQAVGNSAGEMWRILAGKVQGILPKEVEIAYETESGETQYMSFLPVFPSPGCRPSSEVADDMSFIKEESHPKLNSRHGKGSPEGEQEGVNLRDGSPSSDASHPKARREVVFEKSIKDYEGKERECDDEARVGGDTISICSLD